MILYKILFRIALIGFLSISIFTEEDNKKEKKDDGLETFLEDLTHFEGLIDVYRNDDNGKVYFLIKKEQFFAPTFFLILEVLKYRLLIYLLGIAPFLKRKFHSWR